MKEEIWKDIEGFEGLYQVSSFGRVKSLPRNGTILVPRILKPGKDTNGYLSDKLGYKKSYCRNRIKKYGPVFYEKEKMIVIMDMVSVIPTYTEPSIYDVNLITYCKIKNLNYSTVRGRIRRGWRIEKAVTSTPSAYIEYVAKEGDKNGV